MNFKIDCDNYSEKTCDFKEITKILCAIFNVKATPKMGVDIYVCILSTLPSSICPGPHSLYPSQSCIFPLNMFKRSLHFLFCCCISCHD